MRAPAVHQLLSRRLLRAAADGRVLFSYEGCVECGTCRIVCNEFDNVEWTYPRGGYGIQYRFG